MKKTNWDKYEFRCSQLHKIMTGTINLSEDLLFANMHYTNCCA
mgnify:CR=1 FL=1